MPHFILIIPAYNWALYLPKAIDSVIAQTCIDWELIGVEHILMALPTQSYINDH